MAVADVTGRAPGRAVGRAEPRRPDPSPPDRSRRRSRWAVLLALTAVGVLLTYPFLWLISASLKPRSQVFDNALVPSELAPSNYVALWDAAPVLVWLVNSAVVGVAAALAVTVSSALVAFGFAVFRFPGRNVLFGLVLATMMLPGAVTMVPQYLLWNELGLASTQVPLWAQNLFGSAFYIFLLRQFFLSLPRDLFEAAMLDGASWWRIFRSVAAPLSVPALVIVFVFELRASWTDLVKPLIYLRDPQLFTIPRGLKAVVDQFGQGGEAQWEVVLAASVVTTVPMILLFLVAQRFFVEGIATTGRGGR